MSGPIDVAALHPAGCLAAVYLPSVGCGYGQEHLMSACEERQLPYLFKLRFTRGVKDLVRRMCYNGSAWQADGHGWEVMESTLQLSGWSRERRVIVVREQAASAPIDENPAHQVRPAKRRGKDRDIIPGAETWKSTAPWSGKLAVLVTSLDCMEYPATCMAQQYRDRGDAENNYDELKNQWGWNGYCQQQQRNSGWLSPFGRLDQKTVSLPDHGQPHRPDLQLVEPLCAPL